MGRSSPSIVAAPQSAVQNYRANFQSWHCRKKKLYCLYFVLLYFSCISLSSRFPHHPVPDCQPRAVIPTDCPALRIVHPVRAALRIHARTDNILVKRDERTPHRSGDAMVCLNFVTPRFSVKISLCPTALLSPSSPLKTGVRNCRS